MHNSPPIYVDIIYIYIYIPGTQMTLVLIGRFGGLTFKNRGHWVPGIHMYIVVLVELSESAT